MAIARAQLCIVRLVGALLLEQNDEWAVTRRYMTLEALDGLNHDAAARKRWSCRSDKCKVFRQAC